MTKKFKRAISVFAIAAATLGSSSAAQAQLTFQGVTFTPSWSGNVLTLEIDAASPSGDWFGADYIGALQIKSIGSWDSVSLTGPGAAGSWTIVDQELNASGCVSGGGGGNQNACAFGANIPLTDDMVFQFTFTGGSQDFTMPHFKVQMFAEGGTRKMGELMSKDIPAIPEPGTYAMLLGGLGVLAVARRNAKKKAA